MADQKMGDGDGRPKKMGVLEMRVCRVFYNDKWLIECLTGRHFYEKMKLHSFIIFKCFAVELWKAPINVI